MLYNSNLYLSINYSSKGQIVKEVSEIFPHVGVAVLPQTLVVEAIHLRDLSVLVIASQDGDSVWEANLREYGTRLGNV